MSRRIQNLFIVMVLCIWNGPAWAISDAEIPEPLRPWKAWVMHGQEAAGCPFLYSQHQRKFCAWPESLKLSVDSEGVSFRQKWTVFAESEIQLPGDAKNWPVDVSANGRREPILTDKSGRPGIRVAEGSWEIKGRIPLSRRPEFLSIPVTTALLEITVDERKVERPVVDANGRLWLGKRAVKPPQPGVKNAQKVRVFRKLTDEIPLQMETRVQLDISGQERELRMGRLLLENFVPLSLESPLPARIDSDGRLRIQVRPGNWVIKLRARQSGRGESFRIEAMDPDWPSGEIWSFEPRQYLRSVELSGPQGIDPQQTGLPPEWRAFSAYVMSADDELVLKQKHRGDPAPAPDQLTLQRQMWLDFDGGGYTIEDRIKGTVNQDTRLSMQDGYELGRVELNGRPEIVTTMEPGDPAGIEIRQGRVDLLAVSRLTRDSGQGASGWDADFRSGKANVQLPPGWSLMSADGVDRAWPSWISRWNLWDIFIVLIVGAVFSRLYSTQVGLLAFAAVVIGYHEPKAPVLIWLNLAAVLALIALVPASRIRRLLVIYRNLSFLTLALLLLPFAVDQVRQALYPQLEKPWQVVNRQPAPTPAQTESRLRKEAGAMMEMAEAPIARSKQVLKGGASSYDAYRDAEIQQRVQQAYEPGAMIQTGPGQPTWQWNQVSLHWSGPVTRDQRMQLMLISPFVNRVINVASVILFFLLGAVLASRAFRHEGHWQISVPEAAKSGTAMALLACMLIGSGIAPAPAMAETPPPELLKELKKRLLEAPKCLPACASISAMDLQISDEELRAQLEIHVSEQVAVPLPVGRNSWQPVQLETIEEAVITSRNRRVTRPKTPVLSRDTSGQLQVVLEAGRHRLSMSGPVGEADAITLRFPLRPHHVRIVATGWTFSGVVDGDLLADAIELQRNKPEVEPEEVVEREELLPDPIPVFLAVERTLNFGVEWHVNTTVRRIAPPTGPINFRIPLLAGESVTTPGIKTQNGEVLLAYAGRQRAISWYSVLKPEAQFELLAPETDAWVETWRIVADTRWHLETSGLAPVKPAQGRRQPMPEWRPWPGESLQVEVQRPTPVPGPTMTIEGVELEHTPGQRDAASKLSLRLRSSQGGDYQFSLPDGAKLQKLSIDGKEQILPQQRDQVRIPLRPGEQRAVVEWRNPEAVDLRTSSPQLDLARPMRNIDLKLQLPGDRWLLFTGGPKIGPAVLYWGELVVVILVAFGLGRIGGTPLKTWHWALLGAGMLTVDTILASIFVVAWFFLMARREKLTAPIKLEYFNLMQFGLAALSLLALASLASSIPAGLLGQPEMKVVGNGSGGSILRWYQDYSTDQVPVGWVISVPIWTYRVAMLLWALWLAFALLEWIRWGWSCFSANGIWRKRSKINIKPQEVSVQAVAPKHQKPKIRIPKQEPKRDSGKNEPDKSDPWTEE